MYYSYSKKSIETADVSALITTATQLNRFISIPVFVLGLIGNIFNILIFIRPALWRNPCNIYLLSATCANISVLFFGLLIRSLMDGFGIDVIGSSLVLCRLRYLILHPSYVLSSWFLVLASIDRFCISSRTIQLRYVSNSSVARLTILITVCLCLLMHIHILALFNIEQLSSGPHCYAEAGSYRVVYDFLFFVSFSFIPPILMMTVGLATVRNIRLARLRTRPTDGLLNRKDRQLVAMLLVQLIATILCTSPHAIQKLYSTLTINNIKTPFRMAVENLMKQITRELLYINASLSFYLYITSSSSAFRHEFGQIIEKIIVITVGKNSRVHRRYQHVLHRNCRTSTVLTTVEQNMLSLGHTQLDPSVEIIRKNHHEGKKLSLL